jgi:putative spermidine/putrescine transport system ATP-binding protein
VTHDQEEALSLADRLVVLREGRVQQIGTPEELHARPANWHVADFMGFRNLLRLHASEVDSSGVLVEGIGLRLRGMPVGEVTPGAEVVAGIRPEDLRIVGSTADGAVGQIQATVEVVEYQGREFAVEARTSAGVQHTLRTSERPELGEKVTVVADPTRLLVFPAGGVS